MSVTYIPAELRRLVVSRAEGICEYCLISDEDVFYSFQADHVIGEKHGGSTDTANLAIACISCNQAKGSDIGSIFWETGEFVRFFNPRTDAWSQHFEVAGSRIHGRTPVGSVTARILAFNTGERVVERRALQDVGRSPSVVARKRMGL